MKTGFKGPLQPKVTQEKKAPWDFRQPEKDDATSCYVNAGSHYGVGMRQPVGHAGNGALTVEALPQQPRDIMVERAGHRTNLPIDVQQ